MSINGVVCHRDGHGSLLPTSSIDLLDQGLQFGDLLFEGIRFSKAGVLDHQAHLDRMNRSAVKIGIPPPAPAAYNQSLAATIRASGLDEGYARVFLTRGNTGWGIANSSEQTKPSLVVVVGLLSLFRNPNAPKYQLGVICARTRRVPFSCIDATIKWGGVYLNNKTALREAVQAKADDAIMLTTENFISEATVANLFWVRDKSLMTPRADERTNCLPGITRRTIIELAKGSGIRVHEGYYYKKDLDLVDEMFLTGTGAGVKPVTHCDGVAIGRGQPGSITKALMAQYEELRVANATPLDRLLDEYPRGGDVL